MAKTPRPATDTGVTIGQVLLGKYRVEEILGQGGMGIVARCTHLLSDAQVAIKMLRADVLTDDDATQRFMREAQAAVKLRSEYVAHVHDVGTLENGVPYMVMEYLDGHDLGQLLEEQQTVAVQWAVELMLQAAEALAEAHSINIVHRDVKPTNLFVTWRPDGTSLVKVLDFGISKSPMGTDMQLTQTQSLLGTPAYMSPEQMRSARLVDARTDIWSLGTVLYELLEGRRPFEAESFSEMCVKVAVDAPTPMVNTPPALQDVVLRCLAKSPEQRYASMADLGRDLIPFARDPHQAAMLVERMTRMLGRASAGGWEGNTTGTGMQPLRTPVPGALRDIKSGPVRSSPGAWHGKSDPSGVAFVDPNTLREKSAPAAVPIDVTPRRNKTPLVIALATFVSVAIGGAVLFAAGREDDDPKPAAPAMADQKIETPPPTPPVEPPPLPAAGSAPATVDVDPKPPEVKVAEDDNKIEIEPPPKKNPIKKPGNKPKKTDKADKKPDVKPVDKTVEKPDRDKLFDPTTAPKPSLEDLYSKPRPEKK